MATATSTLVFEPRKAKTTVFCVNGCLTQNRQARKAASHFCTILDWPVGPVCDNCRRSWRKLWDANRSVDEPEVP